MAITPSTGKESSSTTASLASDPINSNILKTSSIHPTSTQRIANTSNEDFATISSSSSNSIHRRLFNGSRFIIEQSNENLTKSLTDKKMHDKDNSQNVDQLGKGTTSDTIANHPHFSIQSLLEALPAGSVDGANPSLDINNIRMKQHVEGERIHKRASLSSVSTDGSRVSGDFDGFFYI